ncbi:MAG: deoxyribose-phosphate aldolase [Spirochaetota bacterium]|nr:MAG: deoxyribose-phosphate aldolase [Spirochaetota bacterium]
MEQKQLIERITEEVMKRIQAVGVKEREEIPDAGNAVISPANLVKYIDHTQLKPEATKEQIETLCKEAKEYGFYGICVNTTWVGYCAKLLRGSGVKIACVIGFPLGAMDSRAKAFETRRAIEDGADEIDMVINVGALKSGDLDLVEEDIRAVSRACRITTVLKVIIETCLLTDDEKVLACQIAKKAGAHYVKTSTGFGKEGATAHDVALMRRAVGPDMGIKAAGGIRSFEDAKLMIESGATRLGTSSSVKIVSGGSSKEKY